MTILSASFGGGRCSALASSWCAHPHVPLLVREQDHRHGLGMDRLDHRVRRCRQKSIYLLRPRHWLGLCAAITIERRPDASEGGERSVVVDDEPDYVLFLGVRVRLWRIFRKAVEWD